MRVGYGFEAILNSIWIQIFAFSYELETRCWRERRSASRFALRRYKAEVSWGDRLSLRRQIEPSSIHAVLHLDNPEVGVEGDLSFEPRLGVLGRDQWPRVCPGEHPVDAARRLSRT